MLQVPSMEGLGRCGWKAMALPLDTKRQTTTLTNGPGYEVPSPKLPPIGGPTHWLRGAARRREAPL
jgi:hypothetical protein